jgi:hypothetical protein
MVMPPHLPHAPPSCHASPPLPPQALLSPLLSPLLPPSLSPFLSPSGVQDVLDQRTDWSKELGRSPPVRCMRRPKAPRRLQSNNTRPSNPGPAQTVTLRSEDEGSGAQTPMSPSG